jgi:hypothetical protein
MIKFPRELENYRREALASGWQLRPLRSGTLWLPPEGEAITTHHGHPSRPQDPRSVKNAAARLRRAGLTGSGKPNGRKS